MRTAHDVGFLDRVLVADGQAAHRSYTESEIRAVPTLSNGFIEATTRNVDAAVIVPTRGTVTARSAIAASSALSVSSGARLSSSM